MGGGVGGGGVGEHGVGRGVETVGEGDSHGRGYLRIARLKVEVS